MSYQGNSMSGRMTPDPRSSMATTVINNEYVPSKSPYIDTIQSISPPIVTTYQMAPGIGDVTFTNIHHHTNYLITIPDQINLYHGSETISGFSSNDIQLEKNTTMALFSNNIFLAGAKMADCSHYPLRDGWLHSFRVTKPIERVRIISPGEIRKDNANLIDLEDIYCHGKNGRDKTSELDKGRFDGVAFYLERQNYEAKLNGPSKVYDLVIGICNPNKYLSYVETRQCIGPYKLSSPNNFETATNEYPMHPQALSGYRGGPMGSLTGNKNVL